MNLNPNISCAAPVGLNELDGPIIRLIGLHAVFKQTVSPCQLMKILHRVHPEKIKTCLV